MKEQQQHMALEPTGSRMDMTENDSFLGASQQSTKSSKGRKLRQVLQKKQLDVLLQTYSSYIEESSDNRDGATSPAMASDFFSIARKKSIEGNHSAPIPRVTRSTDNMPTKYRAPDVDVSRDRMRKTKSLMTDESEYAESVAEDYVSSVGEDDYGYSSAEETEDESDFAGSDFALMGSMKGRKPKETVEGRRKKPKRTSTQKRKKRADLKERLSKANEALKGFSSRAAQKHMEIAADFQAVTMELGHHLKSGANIVFEELADHFDGIVEDLFVGVNNEQRDDDGPREPSQSQSADQNRQGTPQIVDPDFHPLSHDEALKVMNKQVSELLQPVKVLTHNVHMGCTAPGIQTNMGCTAPGIQDEFTAENRDLPVSSISSF